MKKYLLIIAAVLLLVVEFICIGYEFGKAKRPDPVVTHDTTTIVKTRIDTLVVRVPVTKNVHTIDTLYMDSPLDITPLPIEQKIYKADSAFTAYISGYHAKLDSIEIYPLTRYVYSTVTETQTLPQTVKRPARWGIGLTGGYGVGKDGLTPFVGFGVTFTLLSF